MHQILNVLPAGRAVDAACGTGRYSAYLAGRGHAVVGVDSSADMLAVARARLPHSDFLAGSLDNLPVPDSSADLVVCALALAHMPELSVVMAEFARVLRPGGHLVMSEAHHELILRGSVVRARDAQDTLTRRAAAMSGADSHWSSASISSWRLTRGLAGRRDTPRASRRR
jgi:ubiquinone/menaquinone biosynthesis C-methylase UbiE